MGALVALQSVGLLLRAWCVAMPCGHVGVVCTSSCLPGLLSALQSVDSGFSVRALWSPSQERAMETAADRDVPFVAARPDEVLLRKEVC